MTNRHQMTYDQVISIAETTLDITRERVYASKQHLLLRLTNYFSLFSQWDKDFKKNSQRNNLDDLNCCGIVFGLLEINGI